MSGAVGDDDTVDTEESSFDPEVVQRLLTRAAKHTQSQRSRHRIEELEALGKTLQWGRILAAQVVDLKKSQLELEAQLKIEQSNLTLAETHVQSLEDALRRRPVANANRAQASPASPPGSNSTPTTYNPKPSEDSSDFSSRDKLSFWKLGRRKRSPLPSPSISPRPATASSTHTDETHSPSLFSYDRSSQSIPTDANSNNQSQSDDPTSSLQQSLESVSEQHAQLRDRYSKLSSEHSTLLSTVSNLKAERDKAQETLDAQQSEIENLSQSLFEEANKMVAEARRENHELSIQLSMRDTELEQSRSARNSETNAKDALQQENQTLRQKIAAQEENNAKLTRHVADLGREITRYTNRLAELELQSALGWKSGSEKDFGRKESTSSLAESFSSNASNLSSPPTRSRLADPKLKDGQRWQPLSARRKVSESAESISSNPSSKINRGPENFSNTPSNNRSAWTSSSSKESSPADRSNELRKASSSSKDSSPANRSNESKKIHPTSRRQDSLSSDAADATNQQQTRKRTGQRQRPPNLDNASLSSVSLSTEALGNLILDDPASSESTPLAPTSQSHMYTPPPVSDQPSRAVGLEPALAIREEEPRPSSSFSADSRPSTSRSSTRSRQHSSESSRDSDRKIEMAKLSLQKMRPSDSSPGSDSSRKPKNTESSERRTAGSSRRDNNSRNVSQQQSSPAPASSRVAAKLSASSSVKSTSASTPSPPSSNNRSVSKSPGQFSNSGRSRLLSPNSQRSEPKSSSSPQYQSIVDSSDLDDLMVDIASVAKGL